MRASVVALTVSAIGLVFAQQKQAPAKGNVEAVKSARAAVDRGLAAFERLDPEALKALSTTDIVAYDIDLENKPVRVGSQDEVVRYVEDIAAAAKKMGATLKLENRKYDCRATSDMACCLLEYDAVATMPDGARMVQPSQTTIVLSKSSGAWKWAHWHTSLSAPATSSPGH